MSGFESPPFAIMLNRLSEALSTWFDAQESVPDVQDRRMFAETHMRELLAELAQDLATEGKPHLSIADEEALVTAVVTRAFGTPWEQWMDGTYSDIYIWPDHAIGKNAATGARETLAIPSVSENELQAQIPTA